MILYNENIIKDDLAEDLMRVRLVVDIHSF